MYVPLESTYGYDPHLQMLAFKAMVVSSTPMISNQHPQCVFNPSLGVYSCS